MKSDATEGFVQDDGAIAWSNTTASAAKRESSGAVSRE